MAFVISFFKAFLTNDRILMHLAILTSPADFSV